MERSPGVSQRRGLALRPHVGPRHVKTDPATGLPTADLDGSGAPRSRYLYEAVSTPFTGGDPEPNPSPALSRGTIRVPYDPTFVDPDVVGIHGSDWEGNRPGLFDFSVHSTVQFNALQPTTGQVRVQWRFTPTGPYSDQSEDYPEWAVDDCYLIDVEPGRWPNEVTYRVPRDQVAVAVLTTPGFDAKRIEADTVRFGTNGKAAKPHYQGRRRRRRRGSRLRREVRDRAHRHPVCFDLCAARRPRWTTGGPCPDRTSSSRSAADLMATPPERMMRRACIKGHTEDSGASAINSESAGGSDVNTIDGRAGRMLRRGLILGTLAATLALSACGGGDSKDAQGDGAGGRPASRSGAAR